MSNIPNLASLARLRLWSWGWSTVRRKAFWFDWVNDYISSNATIGRTGYDMNVSGNVTTGSDGDGSYIWINWNRSHTASTGTRAEMLQTTWPTLTQATSFTMKVRFKIIATQPDNACGLFGYNYGATIWMENNNLATWFKCRIREGASLQDVSMWTYALNTMYDAYLVYDANDQKMYCYLDSTLINVGWTTVSFSFTDNANLYLGDNSIGWWNASSSNKYIYHACIRNKALTQAEVDADIALWNTTKQDPSIVAYYVPDNLQFNTDYITTKDFSNVARTKTGTTVTSGIADIRWWTDAYTLTMSAGAGNGATITNNTVTWSSLASKTFIMKVFAWTASWTATMRLRISHNGVSTYYSADQTVTTTPQEFTFTQALTSSTSGTWMTYWIEVWSAAWAATINVFYPTDWLTNQTLRDESPNIWWFIGRKQNKVLSCRVKPNIDWVATSSSQPLLRVPRLVSYIANSTNNPVTRYDNRLWWQQTTWWSLWAWFRWKVHYSFTYKRDTTNLLRVLVIYKNWILDITQNKQAIPPNSIWWAGDTVFRMWIHPAPVYFSWNIRDARIYTFTWSFTDADALSIYNWWEPTSAWVTKYLHYRPPVGEVWTTTQDQSPNDRDWTLNNGVTRNYI